MSWRAKLWANIADLLWAAVVGFASSLACVAVRLLFRLMQWLITGHSGLLPHAAEALSPWVRAFIPAAGALIAMLVLWSARHFHISGKFEEYVEAVRLHDGRITFLPTFIRTISSTFSVASGAAIGREGVMIQFATAVTSSLGRFRGLSPIPLTTQVACGAAGAVAAAYQAPIAAIFFAMEIVLGRFVLRSVPLLIAASLTGDVMGAWLFGRGPLFRVVNRHQLHFGLDHSLWVVLFLPLLMGLLGPLYYWLLHSLRGMSKWPLALLWSGIIVGLLSVMSSLVWGNGDAALLQITQSSPTFWALTSALVLRLIATTFCVGTGTVGGVFTPTIYVGGAVGYLAALLLHLPNPVSFAILSMGALLAAVTHAPLMASFMTVELTGAWHLLPLILGSAFIALAVARRLSLHSLYAIATPEPTDDVAESDSPGQERWIPSQSIVEMETAGTAE